MAITIGRLQQMGMAKRGTIPTVPITTGTFIFPTDRVRYVPPLAWDQKIGVLASEAISAQAELPTKAVKGAATLNGLKLVTEVEPSNVLGHQLMALFGTDTVRGTGGAGAAHTHNFERLDSALLPVYDFWLQKTNKQFGFAAMMANKGDIFYNKGEKLRMEVEWHGLYYVDGLAISPTGDYPTVQPGMFAQMEVKIAGSKVLNVGEMHFEINNQVVADHTLRDDTNQASFIWSEGQEVNADAAWYFEDATEYNKFLNVASLSQLDQTSSLRATFTSANTEPEQAGNMKLEVLLPKIFYKMAEIQLPTGIVKVAAQIGTIPSTGTVGSGGGAYTNTTSRLAIAQFLNGVVTAF